MSARESIPMRPAMVALWLFVMAIVLLAWAGVRKTITELGRL
jgi:hypothetical protein